MDLYNLHELSDDEDFVELVNAVLHPRVPRLFRERPNNFTKWNNNEFVQRFRLSKEIVRDLIDIVSPTISSSTNRNHALTAADMVFCTLRFLATGSILQVVGDFQGIDKSTASRTCNKLIRSIAQLSPQYIKMPDNDINKVRQAFYNISTFPKCIGALDCTHVKIQSPGGDEAETFRNRKGYFSFNVQAICDAELQIRNIVCRWPGATHDATIFRNCEIRRKFEIEEFGDSLLVGDSGYGIKSYLITPLNNPQTAAEHLFNESQIRTRNTIERCFGVLKRRFPILALGIRLKTNKVESIVVSCAVLHNIACLQRDVIPPVNEEIEAAIELGNVPDIPGAINNPPLNNIVRQTLINGYFQNLLNL